MSLTRNREQKIRYRQRWTVQFAGSFFPRFTDSTERCLRQDEKPSCQSCTVPSPFPHRSAILLGQRAQTLIHLSETGTRLHVLNHFFKKKKTKKGKETKSQRKKNVGDCIAGCARFYDLLPIPAPGVLTPSLSLLVKLLSGIPAGFSTASISFLASFQLSRLV